MPRVKGGLSARKRHRKLLKNAKGYWGARSVFIRLAWDAVDTAAKYATRDRRQKKREFRTLWTARVSASLRNLGTNWSRFSNHLKNAQIELNRKSLSEIAIHDPDGLKAIVNAVQK